MHFNLQVLLFAGSPGLCCMVARSAGSYVPGPNMPFLMQQYKAGYILFKRDLNEKLRLVIAGKKEGSAHADSFSVL